MILDYNETWPRHFGEVSEYLEEVLSTDVKSVEHVGGTSVEGSVCKPIIDIHLVVIDRDALTRVLEALAVLGYVHEGDRGIPGRETFRRKGPDVPFRDPKRDWFPHSLQASIEGEAELGRRIALRDFLRSHPDDRDAYAALKRSLIDVHGQDREAYERGKAEYADRMLARAGYRG